MNKLWKDLSIYKERVNELLYYLGEIELKQDDISFISDLIDDVKDAETNLGGVK